MLKNYLITAIRSFKASLSHSVINIIGLSIGLACALTVFTIIHFEYSFDDFHSKADDTYRVTRIRQGNFTRYDGIVPYPVGDMLRNDVAGIQKVVEFHGPTQEEISFLDEHDQFEIFNEDGILWTTSEFVEVLDFKILKGNKEDLNQPFNVFLTESIAKKYFLDKDPIGQSIDMNGETKLNVVGVIQDSPKNTNLPFTLVVSLNTLKETEPRIWQNWGMTWSYTTYIIPEEGASISQLEQKIDEVFDSYAFVDVPEEAETTSFILQPLKEVHTDEKYGDENHYVTPSLMIYAFIFLASLILGTACLNFININTSIAVRRSKEIGIRKTLGGLRNQLFFQFLFETFVTVSISMAIAFTIGQILIDGFNKSLTIITYDLTYHPNIIYFAIICVLLVSVTAGAYPAMILSGFQPVEAIKNQITLKKGSGNFNLRRVLIITQFAFTSILIVCTLIVAEQVDFVKNRDAGFSSEGVYLLDLPESSIEKRNSFISHLRSKESISEASLAFSAPMASYGWNNTFEIPGKETKDNQVSSLKFVDESYISFYDIELLAGTNLSNKKINDSTHHVLINKHMVTFADWESPEKAIGKTFKVNDDMMKVVGVISDFNVYTQAKIRPVTMYYRPGMMNMVSMKFNSDRPEDHFVEIEQAFQTFFPNNLFSFRSLQADIDEEFVVEDLFAKVVQFVSFLSVILSCMGLYGLVSFMANRNAKTIGIRKVFGASVSSILSFFTKEYIRLIFIAFLIAAPISYFLIDIWIQEFTYRISIGFKFFILGFLITTLITLLTVGYRSWLAAKANPIQSLRYE